MTPFRSTKFLLWVSAGLALAAVTLYAALWFVFTLEQSRVSAAAGALADAAQARISDTALRALLSETEEKRAQANELFVGRGDTVAFLKDLEVVGADAGVKTKVVSVAKAESVEDADTLAEAGLETLAIAVEASGSFSGTHRFLVLLERMPRTISIRRASFAMDDNGIWNGVFEIQVLKIK
ncbi:MAG: hypothetical protein A3C08_00735 [Candidatus Taylorbacteria bacterium RIFCSPHIGHO2_02_FULL_47_18]|uniref:Uncharacterized protein n=1 Tax=Candidatus Taylorbacteria bacterium RIFCSPLOWO2_01_FULL_48_100 TaxID=1802322 RepID=A0A1G2NGN7_9BACT|nr:MAG: hypothetical protein A2670_00550 [Candidatus Taylorbacteria bacterium RIFCSPHIGHO2_01_FULL_48_38]OHA27498.1 MAG: hypothetical protein A3C08_00735 [Candidatus Taylorbacteria bacterium RIFCSPHIGHO2_02_FULL_47_18]OHA34561.1 MAG: hypothetical protein A2938_03355 [Candidatus Taylorbacteria bacterium RIFCSPLOWO2_01_FULL_48_100]OHA40325.1 MAG: hypothetical protein A3J31_01830 [Candidatus Taylorbacteria bacterium RIFCSPLOWO2_02_FULL_48_16]OHA44984.1 MAG: hypothetical protein A3H13_03665 [Candid